MPNFLQAKAEFSFLAFPKYSAHVILFQVVIYIINTLLVLV